jgi:uncharacterized Zn finger protein
MARKRSSYYDSYWPRYTPPIDVKDGIRARSQRGRFVKNWWADRWIRTLSGLMDAGRLSRGRSYARRGQVINIDVQPGYVSARVQGSQRSPYRVSIQLAPLDDRQWERVLDALAEQAIFAAQLLNGEMPVDIERVFAAVQVPLFPAARGDLATECSCPDWVNPCKHIAAVYYLLGERFDEDPFLLFKLRGRDKDQVATALRERRGQGLETAETLLDLPGELEAVVAPPLEACLAEYWTLGDSAAQVALHVAGPKVDMALIKRLGVPDFMDAQTFWVQMERVYAGATAQALAVAFADKEPDG